MGEEIIRAGGVVLIVEMMRQGRSPQEACEAMIAGINAVAKRRGVRPAEVGVLARIRKAKSAPPARSQRNSPTRSAVPAECRCGKGLKFHGEISGFTSRATTASPNMDCQHHGDDGLSDLLTIAPPVM